MENNNQKKKNDFSGAITILIIISLLWGVPSLIRGEGFIYGIIENIRALIFLLVVGTIAIGIFKVLSEK